MKQSDKNKPSPTPHHPEYLFLGKGKQINNDKQVEGAYSPTSVIVGNDPPPDRLKTHRVLSFCHSERSEESLLSS